MLTAPVLIAAANGGIIGAGTIIAQAPDPGNVSAYLFGGGATAILAGLVVEVARRLMNGTLVPRTVKSYQDDLAAQVAAAGEREEAAMREREAMRDERQALRRHAEDLNRTGEELRAEVRRLVRIIEDK
jgi:hypothetical protein